MDYGLNTSISLIKEDGDYHLKIGFENADGVNINYEDWGEDPEVLFDAALQSVVDEYYKQMYEEIEPEEDEIEPYDELEEAYDYIAELEAKVERLEKNLHSSKIDNEVLQKRVGDVINKKSNMPNKRKGMKTSYRPMQFFYRDLFW